MAKEAMREIEKMAFSARCDLWDRTNEPFKENDPDFERKWDEWMSFLNKNYIACR